MAISMITVIMLLVGPFQVPDFTGTWKLQALDGANVVGLTAQLQPQLISEKILIVRQTASALTTARQGSGASAETKYTLGGKGTGGAIWDQHKLLMTRTMDLTLDGATGRFDAQETWSLSREGSTLTVRVAIHISKAQDYVVQLTYRKQ